MPNLLEKTIEALANNGLTPADVLWVGNVIAGSARSSEPWERFAAVANREYDPCWYNSGEDKPSVAENLVIVGTHWWLSRHIDFEGGLTGWQFNHMPSGGHKAWRSEEHTSELQSH